MATVDVLTPDQVGIDDAQAVHEKVAAMTRDMFGGPVSIRRESDPEIPGEYFVVYATVHGEVSKIVELNQRWHMDISQAAGELADQYRLTFDLA